MSSLNQTLRDCALSGASLVISRQKSAKEKMHYRNKLTFVNAVPS
jgi:hypothetical protein